MLHWYLDGTAAGQLQAFQRLSQGLAERPAMYGVSPADAAEALRLVEAAETAKRVADAPETRTQLAVAAKQQALTAARTYCTRLVNFIRLNPNVSDADRATIGVPPPTEKRRIPAPTTTPMLSISRIVAGGHEIEMFDSATPEKRRKPLDTTGLELMVAYSANQGDTGLGVESILKHGETHAILTRGLSTVIHPNERVGSVANYIGRWINARREFGPWSAPVRMVLAIPGGEMKRPMAA